MKPKIRALALLLSLGLGLPALAEIRFSGPDINPSGSVLFVAESAVPGAASYRTLFVRSIDGKRDEQLTFYPESLTALSSGRVLQLRNRYGVARYDVASSSFRWIGDGRPFAPGGKVPLGTLEPIEPSPDGRWLVTVEPVSAAWGRLVIQDVAKGSRCVIDERVERGRVPARWSPDSSVLVYAIRDVLYFSRPETFFSMSRVPGEYQSLGSGGVESVSWQSAGQLFYARGDTVYRILAGELFARSLYADLIGPGELAGKLPAPFDPETDRLCVAPDGQALLYARGNRGVYYCALDGDDYRPRSRDAVYPYLLLPGNTASVRLVWTASGSAACFAESVEDGKRTLRAWRLEGQGDRAAFKPFAVPAMAEHPIVSPTGKAACFVSRGTVTVYDPAEWKEVARYSDEPVVSACWADDDSLFLGTAVATRRWNRLSGLSSVLLVSSVDAYGWDESGTGIVADVGSLGRHSYDGSMKWSAAPGKPMRPGELANADWRLYLDSGAGYYANMIFARSSRSPGGTAPLLPEPPPRRGAASASASGTAPAPTDAAVFSNGKRTGSRRVALAFDAVDSLDGLPLILRVLDRYGVKATFFVNGEFIRRHPAAVNEIARSGHQAASLFFTTWDLSSPRYRIDADFIVRGLARNEDDYYAATGQELSLLWHAPHYVTSPLIAEAGKKAGYRYVLPDVTVLDWVTADEKRLMPGAYKAACDIVEDVLRDVKPGSVVPVRVGKTPGYRADYLYQKIELLVNALVEEGYEIVPVGTLVAPGN